MSKFIAGDKVERGDLVYLDGVTTEGETLAGIVRPCSLSLSRQFPSGIIGFARRNIAKNELFVYDPTGKTGDVMPTTEGSASLQT